MACYLCGSREYETVLDKAPVPIWTNADDQEAGSPRMPCILRQCRDCGHIYQPMGRELNKALLDIYSSKQAQVSTSMGKSNWGEARGQAFLEVFLALVDISKYDSMLELGCDQGYLLKAIKDRGGRNLAGIEPSLPQSIQKEGIDLIKGFAHGDLIMGRKYSLIFSCGVFEHIEDINSIMRFCVNNLTPDGELYISVPNAEQYIKEADPGMFTHQHVQYFTENSLRRLLASHGFDIKTVIKDKNGLEVLSQRSAVPQAATKVVLHTDYEKRLGQVLAKAANALDQTPVIVHAANNTLNNILGWVNKEFAFTLVDNDATKQGKTYFGKKVQSLQNLDLNGYRNVLIMPNAFSPDIRAQYQQRKFLGMIEDLMLT